MTEEFLRQKYLIEQLSLRQIAAQAGVEAATVRYHMKRFDIPRRTRSEALAGDKNPMYGQPKSEEARRKTSKSLRLTNLDPKVRARRSQAASGSNNVMFGRRHTEASRQVMSEKQRARCSNPEVRAALSQQASEGWSKPGVREIISTAAKLRVREKNSFFGKKHNTEAKQQISKANQNRFRGPKGSNWKGGLTPLYLQIRNSSKMEAWRKDIFVRDNFTCVLCGKRGGKLNADHINPFARILYGAKVTTLEEAEALPELWDLANGRTLCVPCHRKTDTFAGRTRVV